MTVTCDTSTVPLAERADLWIAVTSEMFVPLECTPHDRAAFRGHLTGGTIGPVHLCSLEVSPHTIRRTRTLAANTKGDQYKLSLLLGGEALIVQDERNAVLRPGDFAIYDCSRPYTIVGNDPFRMLVCALPHDVIGLPAERVARITATRMPGRGGIAWAMTPFLKRLANLVIRDEGPPDVHRVAESVVDLVESLCVSAMGDDVSPRAQSRAELLLRIRAYIEAHLDDPDLAPTQIASAHFVSKRYLHKLAESEGTTVARWIRERRLERCRRDLVDQRCRDETVSSIGIRWGLTDAAHFSRLFRDAFGCSPTEYRQRHIHPDRVSADRAL